MRAASRLALLAALFIAVAGAIWLLSARRGAAPPATARGPQVSVAVVREGSVEETTSLTGRVGSPAGMQTKLAFSLPGTVASVDVRLGDRVDAGAPLARLDPTSYALSARQAEAEARAAAAGSAFTGVDRVGVKLHVDEAELQRKERLFRAGIVALRDVEAAREAVAADRAERMGAHLAVDQAVAQARAASARSASASYDLGRTTLRAPAPGTVVGIFVAPGQTTDSSAPAIAIASDRQHLVTLDVPVQQLSRVRTGNLVRLRSDAGRWLGRVEGVAPAVDPSTGLALLSVTGVPPGVATGTPVDATVVVGVVHGLVVPIDAIVSDPQTGAQLVFVQTLDRAGSAHFAARTVHADAHDDRLMRIVSGLQNGERIAAQGAIDLLAVPGDQRP